MDQYETSPLYILEFTTQFQSFKIYYRLVITSFISNDFSKEKFTITNAYLNSPLELYFKTNFELEKAHLSN